MKKRIDLLTLFIFFICFNQLSAFGDGNIVDTTIDDTTTTRIDQGPTRQEAELQEEDARRRAAEEAEIALLRAKEEQEHDQHLRDDNGSQHQDSDTTAAKTPSSTPRSTDIVTEGNDAGAAKLTDAEKNALEQEEARRKKMEQQQLSHQLTAEETDPLTVRVPAEFLNIGQIGDQYEAMKNNFDKLKNQELKAEAKIVVQSLQIVIDSVEREATGQERLTPNQSTMLKNAFSSALERSRSLLMKQILAESKEEAITKKKKLAQETRIQQSPTTLTNIPKALLKNNLIALRVAEIENAKDKLNSEQTIKAQQIIKTLNETIQSMIKNGPEQKRFWILKKWSNEQQNTLAAQLLEAEQALRGLYRTTPVAATGERVEKPSLVDQEIIPKKFIKRFKLQAYETELKAVIGAFRNEEPSDQANKAEWTKQNQQIEEEITTLQNNLGGKGNTNAHAQLFVKRALYNINKIINEGSL